MTRQKYSASGLSREDDGTAELRQALRRELLALDFNAFERCVAALLRSLGYEKVRIRREGVEGRNRDGGWDMDAALSTGLIPVRTIAQVKQYESIPVEKRFVNELRGCLLQERADQGLLITLSTFPLTARDAAAGAIAPVRLIDGDEFVRLMVDHGIGVTENGGGLRVDRAFFGGLGSAARVVRNGAAGRHHGAKGRGGAAAVTVVVVSDSPPKIEWKGKA